MPALVKHLRQWHSFTSCYNQLCLLCVFLFLCNNYVHLHLDLIICNFLCVHFFIYCNNVFLCLDLILCNFVCVFSYFYDNNIILCFDLILCNSCLCVCVCVFFYDNDVFMYLTLISCNSFVCILSFCINGVLSNLLWSFTIMCIKKKFYHNSRFLSILLRSSLFMCVHSFLW
jgi:hypothetical protein